MAKRQWQYDASAGRFELEYEASGYRMRGLVKLEGALWVGRYSVSHVEDPSRAGAGGTVPAASSLAHAMRSVEATLEATCERLKSTPC